MIIAKVIGMVVSTRKEEDLKGFKLLVVQPLTPEGKQRGDPFVAVDTVGAGIGEMVVVALGSPARLAVDNPEAPVDASIVGIIDSIDIGK
ncbi:EutN/CcmL family microcompartment protein [bacterium]|nr:EutN/CcmL family microcompartment protein [bacterium]